MPEKARQQRRCQHRIPHSAKWHQDLRRTMSLTQVQVSIPIPHIMLSGQTNSHVTHISRCFLVFEATLRPLVLVRTCRRARETGVRRRTSTQSSACLTQSIQYAKQVAKVRPRRGSRITLETPVPLCSMLAPHLPVLLLQATLTRLARIVCKVRAVLRGKIRPVPFLRVVCSIPSGKVVHI